MDKSKIILVSAVGVILILPAVLWLFVLQQDQKVEINQAEKLLDSGIALFNEKKYDEALETLQRVPSGSVQEAKARYYQGSTQILLKDFESAADNLEKALMLNSKDVGTLYALGVVYYKLGNLKLASGYFASVLEINPDDQHAKGLMDILSKLERQSVAQPESESNKPDLTSMPGAIEGTGN